jgi:hypothetical protein
MAKTYYLVYCRKHDDKLIMRFDELNRHPLPEVFKLDRVAAIEGKRDAYSHRQA